MENQTGDCSQDVPCCLNCGEARRLAVGSFGATSPFGVRTGRALGVMPVGHPSYLEGVVCLACGDVRLRLAERDLKHLRSKLEE